MLNNKKFLTIALAVSLAINLIIIGAAGSATWRWHKIRSDGNWLENRLDRTEGRILRRLEGDDRVLAERVFRERRPQLSAAIAEIRAARRDFRDSLSVETPDPAALTAALDRSQAAARQINENVHGAVRDMAQGLSVEARRKIAEKMQRHRDEDQ